MDQSYAHPTLRSRNVFSVQYADFGFPTRSQFVPKFRPTMHRRCMRHFMHARDLARLL